MADMSCCRFNDTLIDLEDCGEIAGNFDEDCMDSIHAEEEEEE